MKMLETRAAVWLSALLLCAPAPVAAQGSFLDRNSLPNVLSGTVLAGTMPGAGQSAGKAFRGAFNVTLSESGGSATCGLDRSFDAGATWAPYSYPNGAALSVTVTSSATFILAEVEAGVIWRLNCSAVTGTLTYRVSQ